MAPTPFSSIETERLVSIAMPRARHKMPQGVEATRPREADSESSSGLAVTLMRALCPPRVGSNQGSANTKRALPRVEPYSSGLNPFIHPPQPVGTATYCLPFTL